MATVPRMSWWWECSTTGSTGYLCIVAMRPLNNVPRNGISDIGVRIGKFSEMVIDWDIRKFHNLLILLVKDSFLRYTLPLTTVGHWCGKVWDSRSGRALLN